MFLVPRSTKIYMGRSPVNMGKSFDGLSNEVRAVLRKDPLSGHIFIFFNRRRTIAKMIVWTRGGYTIVAKRLERGTFALPEADAACVELDIHELALLLEGNWVGPWSAETWGRTCYPPPRLRGDGRLLPNPRADLCELPGPLPRTGEAR